MRPDDDAPDVGPDAGPEAGMLLPEVLVGLAILALATIVMLRVFSGATTAIRAVEASRVRMDIAENLLARIVADRHALPPMQSGGADGLAWTVDSLPLGDAKPGTNPPGSGLTPYRVRISVGPGTPLIETVILGAGQ
jgi:type II secretory pathway pseudopilin PulG